MLVGLSGAESEPSPAPVREEGDDGWGRPVSGRRRGKG